VKIPQFTYHRPDSVDEALALLADLGDDAKVLAGGQSLVPLMALRLGRPAHVVDIGRLAELATLADDGGTLRVGAMVRHSELEASAAVRDRAPLVSEAMPHIGHRAIRNRGTACGSLAHADPAAELPAVALALDATLVLRSAGRERSVPAAEFFTGYLQTVAEPDELLVEWRVPAGPASSGWSVQEVSRRHGDFALLGCAATVESDDAGRISSAALAFLGAAGTPVRVPEAESLLVGQYPGDEVFGEAAEAVKKTLDPPGDLHASVAHRRHLGAVLTNRCLRQATARLGAAA
jgi:carbon-monoxide dehydrogenase medium subunit